jgi:hypothetical protein
MREKARDGAMIVARARIFAPIRRNMTGEWIKK